MRLRLRRLVAATATIASSVALLGSVPALSDAAAPPTGSITARSAQADRSYVVKRGRHVVVPFVVHRSGETLLDLSAAAPGTDWAVQGQESAVISLSVDRRYATDVVVTGSAPQDQQVALGYVRRGHHKLRVAFADERSAPSATKVTISGLDTATYAPGDPEYAALRYAPIVHGRDLADLGDANQNAVTDTPLVAWHEERASSTPGHTQLVYSVVWSNEDGGTNSPALMARWGRTTDIEWIYAVDIDADGERVPGTEIYQAPNHQTLPFQGGYDGDHPRLQTCTSNNNMCDVVDNPLRFFPSAAQTLPAGKAREHLMDVNPWTYLVMAKELIREGKVEPPSPETPATPEVSDQRNYLYATVTRTTTGDPGGSSWAGLSLGVRLTSGETIYLAHHTDPTWSLRGNGTQATTVELPAGTKVGDIAEVSAHRIVVGTDPGATIRVTGIGRGFLLGDDYLPQESFLSWSGDVVLTPDAPTAVLWSR
jgi:hypothetical protein